MLLKNILTLFSLSAEEVANQLSDSLTQMVVCDGALEDKVRKAFQIMKKDLPLMSIGGKSLNNLPRVADILTDTSLGFADPAQVIR